ncbi:MAG: hypothetical protein MZW92_23310 [Comamonadaceae bacterium]|nr:hypothetical protein [Comamonadaceae bacterium]
MVALLTVGVLFVANRPLESSRPALSEAERRAARERAGRRRPALAGPAGRRRQGARPGAEEDPAARRTTARCTANSGSPEELLVAVAAQRSPGARWCWP